MGESGDHEVPDIPDGMLFRTLGGGPYVELDYADGMRLVGRVGLFELGGVRFGTRTRTLLEADGRPCLHLGRVPISSQVLDLAVAPGADAVIAARIADLVRLEEAGGLGRDVVVGGTELRWVEDRVLLRHRVARGLRRVLACLGLSLQPRTATGDRPIRRQEV
jgi:hypothetical protein